MNGPISVCMATYNGAKFLREQVGSILNELSPEDELIVVDDGSVDQTVAILRSIDDGRIRIYENEKNSGEVHSFSKAIELSKGAIVFLSDQDDVWLPGKVKKMSSELCKDSSLLITSNFEWIDAYGRKLEIYYDGVSEADSCNHTKNISGLFFGKASYFGCAMAFKAELKKLICPIPDWVESHDIWIAFGANLIGLNKHLNDKTFLKRAHGENATNPVSKRHLSAKLFSRYIFLRSLLSLRHRIKRQSSEVMTGA